MEHLHELPLPVLLHLFGFAYESLASEILSRTPARIRGCNGCRLRELAAVSTSWAAAITTVDAHFRETIMVFDFQPAPPPPCVDDDATISTDKAMHELAGTIQTPSAGRLQFIRGLLATLTCSSRSSAGRATRISSPDEEPIRSMVRCRREMQIQPEVNVENELKRLLTEVTARRQTGPEELWVHDAFDITVLDIDGDNSRSVSTQQWEAIFSHCSCLQRLDLSMVSLESAHLPTILRAAATHCTDLQELVMPQQECLVYRQRNLVRILEAFHAVIAAWGPSSPSCGHRRRGLKKLVLPWMYPYEYSGDTTAAIGRHCPTLEQVEGLRLAAFSQARRITSDEMRAQWLQNWQPFCQGCISLATLNWCALPCTAELFDIFASHPKLKLKTLILPGNVMLWRRDYVLQERREPQLISSSNRFTPVLYACPNLTNLEVRLSDQRGDDQVLLLGNAFLQDIAKACPKLERLALVETSNHHGFGPSNAFTNEGIEMLVGLPRLHVLALHGVNCSSATLLSLATRTLSRSEPRMRIDVTLGGRGAVVVDVVARFHETLLELVDLLLLPGVNEYPDFVIHVQLDTHNHTLPAMWEMRFMPEWSQLKRDLTRQAGNISFSYDLIRTQATIECRALVKS